MTKLLIVYEDTSERQVVAVIEAESVFEIQAQIDEYIDFCDLLEEVIDRDFSFVDNDLLKDLKRNFKIGGISYTCPLLDTFSLIVELNHLEAGKFFINGVNV